MGNLSINGNTCDLHVWLSKYFNNMEVNFKTQELPRDVNGSLILWERGDCWNAMILMMKNALKLMKDNGECKFLCKTWVEHLVRAAYAHGAKIPKK